MIARRAFPTPPELASPLEERALRGRDSTYVARAVSLDLRYAECACGEVLDVTWVVPGAVVALLSEGARIDPKIAGLLRLRCLSCGAPMRLGSPRYGDAEETPTMEGEHAGQ